MQRQDYTFADLLALGDDTKQMRLDDTPSEEGKFLKRYVSHYRKVQDYD
jgi:hypothetical protein